MATYVTTPELGYIHADYYFSGAIMIVPEPATTAALAGVLVLGVVALRRRRR